MVDAVTNTGERVFSSILCPYRPRSQHSTLPIHHHQHGQAPTLLLPGALTTIQPARSAVLGFPALSNLFLFATPVALWVGDTRLWPRRRMCCCCSKISPGPGGGGVINDTPRRRRRGLVVEDDEAGAPCRFVGRAGQRFLAGKVVSTKARVGAVWN